MNFFGKAHEKSQEHNHVLAPIVGKDLGQKFLLGIALGVLEGLINRGFFWFFIFTPSSVQCTGEACGQDEGGGGGGAAGVSPGEDGQAGGRGADLGRGTAGGGIRSQADAE